MMYPLSNSDVPIIFNELLAKKVIDLPMSKWPQETNKVDDPKYYKFHRIVVHPIKMCFILKDKIMTLVRDVQIIIASTEATTVNHVSTKLDYKKDSMLEAWRCMPFVSPMKVEQGTATQQFGCFRPTKVLILKQTSNTLKEDNNSPKK